MSECPICVDPLSPSESISNQTTPGEDTDVCDNVFRLKCGHAFHCNCIVRQLRLKNECPVCRDGAPSGNAAPGTMTIAITNQTIQIPLNDIFQMSDDNVADLPRPAWNTLHQINRLRSESGRVQRQRAKLNRVIKDYVELEKILLDERAHVLRTTLSKFEKDWKPRQDRMCRTLQRSLRKTREVEYTELVAKEGADKAREIFSELNLDAQEYSVRSVARRHMEPILDPSRRSFWHR